MLNKCQDKCKISAISAYSANEKIVALYDRCESHMRFVANVPDSRYTDWFHNLLASGSSIKSINCCTRWANLGLVVKVWTSSRACSLGRTRS